MKRTTTRFWFGLASCALLLPLAACGDDGDGDAGSASTSGTAGAAPTTGTDDAGPAFPVTIEHAFGSTTIDRKPERVVSIGFTDHDALLALGVEPVAIRQWYGDHEFVWPWAEQALGDQRPELIPSGDLSIEQIVALEPDLIIGLQIGLEAAEYEALSKIAPTIAQSGDHPAWGTPWQVNTLTAGRAVGRADEARALIAEVEEQFAAARAAHPEWAGVGLAYAGVYGEGTANFYVETDGSTRMKVLQDLGFVVPAELTALGTDGFYHDVSAERIDLLEQDVVLWEPAVLELLPAVEQNEIYRSLDVYQDDRDIFLTDPVIAGAMAHATALSLPVVLDFLIPELERAVGNLS
jgi:iron complex transport system substrate-binding protein